MGSKYTNTRWSDHKKQGKLKERKIIHAILEAFRGVLIRSKGKEVKEELQ